MIKILIVIISIFISLPAAFAADSGVFIPGNFSSMAGAPDGSVFLLDMDNGLTIVKSDTTKHSISLPKILESKPGDRFCDLVTDGRKVFLCGFPFPVVFELDLENLEEYKVIRPSDQEIASLHILNVTSNKTGLTIRDADGFLFNLENEKPLQKLPEFSSLENDCNGENLIIPPPSDTQNPNSLKGKVALNAAGKIIWTAPAPKAPFMVQSVEFLGTDKQKRNIFMVMTGSGELDSELCLYAVNNDKIEASQKISTPDNLEMQRFCRLSPDGSVLLVEKAPEGQNGIILKRINF